MFMSSTAGVIKLAGDLEFETNIADDQQGYVFAAGVGTAPILGPLGGTWVKDTISGVRFIDFNYVLSTASTDTHILYITTTGVLEQDAWTQITWVSDGSTSTVLSANASQFGTTTSGSAWLFQETNPTWGMDIYNTETLYPVVT